MTAELTIARQPGRLDPLGRRLLIGIVLVSSVVTLVLTGVQMYRDYRNDVHRIEASFDLIRKSYLPTLINSVWHVDAPQTRILIEGMASLPDIELVRVRTPEGTIHDTGAAQSERTLEQRFGLVHQEGQNVGELIVIASLDAIVERLTDRVLFILAGNALKTFLVAGFALMLFHYMVTRHLRRIAAYARSPAAGQSTGPALALERTRSSSAEPDSLSVLESSLNEMWHRLAEESDKLKDSESRLTVYKENLEKLVAERTAALHEAQEELLRAERLSTIGQMTATVSHELRNPLGTLAASVQTLRTDMDLNSERSKRALERINRSIVRCTTIIEELLDFVQARDIATRPMLFDGWIHQVIEDFEFPNGVDWQWHGNAPCTVSFDPDRVQQCVCNVLQNASQCMLEAHGKGRLVVETAVRDDRVEIIISDSGPGVAPELRPRIFEPLFSTRGFGVGLGLPLVLRIMEQHGGGVEVGDSTLGGARFVLWLPLKAHNASLVAGNAVT